MKTFRPTRIALAIAGAMTLVATGGAAIAQTASETEPADTTMTEPMTPGSGADPATDVVVEVPVKPVEGRITMQSDNTLLASNLLGATVYSGSDESVGDTSDLIVNLDGTVEGAVIGVGGLLGIGEKAVAVEMSQRSISMNEENEPRLVRDATMADLDAAPEFVSAEEQQDEAGAAPAQAEIQAPATEPGEMDPTRDPATGALKEPMTEPADADTTQ